MRLLFCLLSLIISFHAHAQSEESALSLDPQLHEETRQFLEGVAVSQLRLIEGKEAKFDRLSENAFFRKKMNDMITLLLRSKRFVGNLMMTAVVDYPQAIVFDSVTRALRISVAYPILIATGNAYIIPLMNISPDQEMMTAGLALYLKWRKSARLKKTYGYGLNELRSGANKIFDVDSMKEIRLHMIQAGEEKILLPLRQKGLFEFRAQALEVLTAADLEKILKDRNFILAARQVVDSPVSYEELLLDRILHKQETREALLEKTRALSVPQGKTDVQKALLELKKTQRMLMEMIKTTRSESGLSWRLYSADARARRSESKEQKKLLLSVSRSLQSLEYEIVAKWLSSKTFDAASFSAQFRELSTHAISPLAFQCERAFIF